MSRVLIVTSSPVNRIVITKILERSCLKPVTASYEKTEKALVESRAGTVIIDGAADEVQHSHLLEMLERRRRSSPHGLPRVIMVSTVRSSARLAASPAIVDAVVPQPITSDTLQPVVETITGRATPTS